MLTKTTSLLLLTIYTIASLIVAGSTVSEQKGRLIVFGDDLGDTGNLQRLTNDSTIGYSDGRLTNGPVFVEYMATILNKRLESYAFGQSSIDDSWPAPEIDGFRIPSLSDQVVNFTETQRDWIRRKPGPQTTVIVNSGTSDIARLKEPLMASLETAQNLVRGVFRQIDVIENLGFSNIVVGNLPALYTFPRWRLSAKVDKLKEFVRTTNRMFRERVVDYQKRASVKLWLLDIEEFMLVTVNSTFAQSIGAQNTTGACITDAGGCGDPADYVFYDDVHMDMRLHHLLGLAAAHMVQGSDLQYNSTFFSELAKEYDIGVLYHTTATTIASASDTMSATTDSKATAAAADPLLTSTSASVANCSLTVACVAIDQSMALPLASYEQNHQTSGASIYIMALLSPTPSVAALATAILTAALLIL